MLCFLLFTLILCNSAEIRLTRSKIGKINRELSASWTINGGSAISFLLRGGILHKVIYFVFGISLKIGYEETFAPFYKTSILINVLSGTFIFTIFTSW